MSDQYTLCAVKIGLVTIGQITDASYSDDVSRLLARDSASGQIRASSVDLQDVRIRFTTEAIYTALGEIGLAGVNLATVNAVAYFAKRTPGGGLNANGCVTITLAKGCGLWRGLSAGDGLASVSFELIGASSDGVTHPAVLATGVALPVVTTKEMYVIATPATAQSLGIDTGIREVPQRDGQQPFFVDVAYEPAAPVVTYSQTDMAAALGIVTDIGSVSLVDATEGGLRGSSPITFTFNQVDGAAESIGGDPTVTGYRLRPTYDGTNAPIVITGLA